jgi:fumarate reductase subunit D
MEQRESILSSHILPVSATMIGVCMTVISVIQIAPKNGVSSWADNLLAIDSLFFLASMMLSYWSLRHKDKLLKLELYADRVFMFGMVVMVSVSFLVAFELFTD